MSKIVELTEHEYEVLKMILSKVLPASDDASPTQKAEQLLQKSEITNRANPKATRRAIAIDTLTKQLGPAFQEYVKIN